MLTFFWCLKPAHINHVDLILIFERVESYWLGAVFSNIVFFILHWKASVHCETEETHKKSNLFWNGIAAALIYCLAKTTKRVSLFNEPTIDNLFFFLDIFPLDVVFVWIWNINSIGYFILFYFFSVQRIISVKFYTFINGLFDLTAVNKLDTIERSNAKYRTNWHWWATDFIKLQYRKLFGTFPPMIPF